MSNSVQHSGSSSTSNKTVNPDKATDRATASIPDKFSQKIKESKYSAGKTPLESKAQISTGKNLSYQSAIQQLTKQNTDTIIEKASSLVDTDTSQAKSEVNTSKQSSETIGLLTAPAGKEISAAAIDSTQDKITSFTEEFLKKAGAAASEPSSNAEESKYKEGNTTEQAGSTAETDNVWSTGKFGVDDKIFQFIKPPAIELIGPPNEKTTEQDNSLTPESEAADEEERSGISETTARLIKQQLGSVEKFFEGQGLFSTTAGTSQLIRDHLSGALLAEMQSTSSDESVTA